MIESIVPAAKRAEIYDFWRKDPTLFERNKYIAQIYQDFIDNQSDKYFARVLIANFLLDNFPEIIFFYQENSQK